MRFVKRALLSSMFLVLLFLNTVLLRAQTETATVSGRVTDSAGAVVPDVDVQLVNKDTEVRMVAKTTRAGLYVFQNVKPGPYRLLVLKDGFKEIVKTGLTLNLQDSLVENFSLQVGSVSESVTVTADQNNINTTDAAVSTVIDQSYLKNMPLNGRSFQDLILLTPGVLTTSSQSGSNGVGQVGEFSVNGQRTESNYYTVDGVSANTGSTIPNGYRTGAASGSLPPSTALGTTQGLVSVDSLQEFRVQSSTYSAEYGRNPGGQFAFVTKSGANDFHGSVFDYFRNGYFDATDWFDGFYGVKGAGIHQNDFGGILGGPIELPHLYHGKDKTFFFVSYEGLRLSNPQAAAVSYVPDAALKASVPTVVLSALKAFPIANGLDLGNGVAEYIGSWSNPSSIDSTSVRLDHALGNKTKLFFRFNDTSSFTKSRPTGGVSNPSNPVTITFALRTYTVGADNALTNQLAHQLRLNYSSNNASQTQTSDAFGGAVPINLAQLGGLPAGAETNFIAFLGNYSLYIEQNGAPLQQIQHQWNLVDSLTLVAGPHIFKFGIDYRRLTPFVQFFDVSGGWNYCSDQELQTNSPCSVGSGARTPYHSLYTNFALFAEDEWRVSSRINLSYGLRWEVNPAPSVTQGEKPWTMVNLNNPNSAWLAPYGTPLWHTTWFNFAPRLGAAYTLRGQSGRETVLRAGGGVFFDTGQQVSATYLGPGTQANSFPTLMPPFPQLPPIPSIMQPSPPYTNVGDVSLNGWYPHLQLPYTLQWNVSVQQGLGQTQSVTLSYLGSHASRLLANTFVAPPDNPLMNANGIYDYLYTYNSHTADYNSLQLQFQRRLSAGLTALASYTFSHCLDYGSVNLLFGYQRGNCDFDVRHNFSSAFSYDVPSVGHNPILAGLLNHWGVDDRFFARTAFPVTVFGNYLQYPNGQFYDGGASLVPGQPIYLYGANCASVFQQLGGLAAGQGCPGGRAINPNAFVSVNTGLGDAPRNFVRGFGAWQMNLAVRREFPIRESLKLQFRAEAFNVFNHPNFGTINSQCCGSNFGLANATLANSLGTLNPLYQMGGPRSMQFSLRLAF